MARKLLVRTPVTTDGVSPQYDEQERKVYRETILPLTARAGLESINANTPDSLRHKFSEVEVDDQGKVVTDKEKTSVSAPMAAGELVKLIAVAETVQEVEELAAGDTRKTVSDAAQKRISELQNQ